MMTKNHSVAILGGGICGLCAAYALKKKGFDITIYEKDKAAGGKIQTFKKDNWLLELGPNTLAVKEEAIWNFLADLNLNDKIIKANKQAQKRYIVRNRSLHAVPDSIFNFLTTKLFSTSAKLRLLKEPFISSSTQDDETLASFIQRRLGEEPLHYGVNPFVAGVYAGDPKKISAQHTFSTLIEMEKEHGSVFKGIIKKKQKKSAKKALISFDQGLHTLPQQLRKKLGSSLKLDTKVAALSRENNGWKVTLNNQKKTNRTFSKVVSTLPPTQLANIWTDSKSRNEIDKLTEITYAPISVIALGFRKDQIVHPLDGFGMLVPEKENFNILGCLFSSTLFPNRAPKNHELLTCFVGGMRQPELANRTTQELKTAVLNDLNDLLGINSDPVFTHHTYYAQAIPQYNVGYDTFSDAAKQIENDNPGFYIHGNFIAGVSVPDCITSSLEMAKRLEES